MEQPTITRMPQRSSRAPTRTGLPPVLVDLITIYDDDEGSVTTHTVPIPITYEEAPGEMTAPTKKDYYRVQKEGTQPLITPMLV
jgi:hypothetical protein